MIRFKFQLPSHAQSVANRFHFVDTDVVGSEKCTIRRNSTRRRFDSALSTHFLWRKKTRMVATLTIQIYLLSSQTRKPL
jgi:hypothetical protein